ncbi:MAG TPA: MFS transporter [Candidatus Paceibacterota bacterium]
MFSHINKVVRLMVVTDFFVNSAFGSFGPVFAIFITSQIAGGSAKVAGFAASIYWIVKSAIQLPIARFLDKTDGERDEFWAVFFGYFLSGLTPFAYLFITEPWHLYLTQAFLGVTMAFAVPAWYSIFTRHVDKWRISFEWSLESVFAVGAATALATAVGGYVADVFGFRVLFIFAGLLATLSSFLLLPLRKHLLPKSQLKTLEKIFPERHHRRH